MNRTGTGLQCDLKDTFAIQITFRGGRRAYANSLISLADMQRMRVRFGIDSNRADTQPPECTDNAARDRTAVGNQNFIKHVQVDTCWLAFRAVPALSLPHGSSRAAPAQAFQINTSTGVGL